MYVTGKFGCYLRGSIDFAGYSHKPEEFASLDDMANGVKVLALTLAKLASSPHTPLQPENFSNDRNSAVFYLSSNARFQNI